ncbi:hypothetical protein QWY31_03450 [Cytophagales bacterium LB-30]|uniref:Bacteriocin n=1 Tax=Shiella aurantiaca TaxID=3058365 RepID=A0ABT8F2A8_9BACT|nr:hypothetical protein [Shiella aurantiaca]MDN4164540.1 hypothetical protein [Shiella aurantiaca]
MKKLEMNEMEMIQGGSMASLMCSINLVVALGDSAISSVERLIIYEMFTNYWGSCAEYV